jgi:hypothetical protein
MIVRGAPDAAKTAGPKPARSFLNFRRSLSVASSTAFLRIHLNVGVTPRRGLESNQNRCENHESLKKAKKNGVLATINKRRSLYPLHTLYKLC